MSEVTICNLALSHLGDTATVASISPPEGSVQAQLCARFYYIARNSLLQSAAWNFALRRIALAEVSDPLAAGQPGASTGGAPCQSPWRFAYALPANVLEAIAVQDKDAPSDTEAWFGPMERDHYRPYPQGYMPVPGAPLMVPQPFEIETNTDGSKVLLTNVPCAVLRFTAIVEDPTKFSPLFTMALSHLLASMLAGPILKGDVGIAAAKGQLELFETWKNKAVASEANQRKTHVEPAVSWIRGR